MRTRRRIDLFGTCLAGADPMISKLESTFFLQSLVAQMH